MLELLAAYSVSEIIVFVVMLAIAIKEVVSFCDWAIGRLKQAFNKGVQEDKEKEGLKNRLKKEDKKIEELAENQKQTCEYLALIAKKVDLLIDSDKNDIKTWITEKHHFFCYEKKWIDDYSLEGIEKRYKNYKDENGNSYVGKLMKDLRALPNEPLEENK